MGYIVLPPHLLKPIKNLVACINKRFLQCNNLPLLPLFKVGIGNVILTEVVRYIKESISLIKSITNEMGNNVHILGEQSGLHIVLHVHNGMNEQELIHAAAKQRIKLYPLSTYDSVHNVREESYVLLGFGSIPENRIETVVQLLKKAWFPK